MSGVKQVAALVDKDGNYYDALNPLPTTGRGRCYPHHDASHLLTDSVQSHNKRRTGMGRYHIDNGDGTGQLRCGGPLDAVSDGGKHHRVQKIYVGARRVNIIHRYWKWHT